MREMGKVILGMPGPWAEDGHEAADHYTTKVGGLPDWPTPDINPDLLKCGLCGGRLYLVSQVYAPISSGHFKIEERTIYVLGCTMSKCGSSSKGWRILRVQKCRSGSQSSASSQEEKIPAESSNAASTVNDWSATDSWMQGSGEQSDGGDESVDLQDLSRAISEAASVACVKKQNKSTCSAVVAKDSKMKPKQHDPSIAVLPCFYIYDQKEKSLHNTINIQDRYSSLSIEDDQSLPAHSADDEKWEAESYEYDKALGADRTYLKFKKRMEAYPEQCIRYSFGGKPLLATNDVGEPGNCGICGSKRHFEMQLMPPLLYYLQQAADGQSTYSPEDWSWLTLIVYTCSKNCFHQTCESKSGHSCWTVSEESTIIQCE